MSRDEISSSADEKESESSIDIRFEARLKQEKKNLSFRINPYMITNGIYQDNIQYQIDLLFDRKYC